MVCCEEFHILLISTKSYIYCIVLLLVLLSICIVYLCTNIVQHKNVYHIPQSKSEVDTLVSKSDSKRSTMAHHEDQYPCERKIWACAGEKCTADGRAIGTEDCWVFCVDLMSYVW